ncbi:hypothetical protein PMV_330 [Port-miou virus]|uniref:Uncharacterized protein n=1 Tax=Port-miou virus TaxID=1733873 RepID=A0A0N9P931_9VIRU|nr:hypothetical protein PMV_330 [Port-miou virus]
MRNFLGKREDVVWSCVFGDKPNPDKYVVFDDEKIPRLPSQEKHGSRNWGDVFVRRELWSFGTLQYYSCDGPSLFTECFFRNGIIQKLLHSDKTHKNMVYKYDGYGRVTKVKYFSFMDGALNGFLEFLWSGDEMTHFANGEIVGTYSSTTLKKNTGTSLPFYIYTGVPFLDGCLVSESFYLHGKKDGVKQKFMLPYLAFLDKFQ